MSSWELGPADLFDDGSRPLTVSAVLANFCADGKLHMATGLLYGNTHSQKASLGVSDGLVVYAGRWKQQGSSVSVEYRVQSAEVRMNTSDGTDRDSMTMSTLVRLGAGQLEFPFQYRGEPQTRVLTLIPAKSFDKQLDPEDHFIRCE